MATALAVRSVTVPVQLVSPAGQLTLTITTPPALAVNEVAVSRASGTAAGGLFDATVVCWPEVVVELCVDVDGQIPYHEIRDGLVWRWIDCPG